MLVADCLRQTSIWKTEVKKSWRSFTVRGVWWTYWCFYLYLFWMVFFFFFFCSCVFWFAVGFVIQVSNIISKINYSVLDHCICFQGGLWYTGTIFKKVCLKRQFTFSLWCVVDFFTLVHTFYFFYPPSGEKQQCWGFARSVQLSLMTSLTPSLTACWLRLSSKREIFSPSFTANINILHFYIHKSWFTLHDILYMDDQSWK